MIKRDDLVKIGKFNKSHGIKGELSFSFTNDSFDNNECSFFICELDAIFVPFKLEEYRFTSNSSALVKLKNVDSEKKARLLVNKEVYFYKAYLKETTLSDIVSWDYFLNFTLIDERFGTIGVITAIDDSTINTLFIIEKENDEIFIPAVDEIITHIDEEQKKIYVELPDGLLQI
jgi:16S rRNA processing protein RimM